MDLLNELVLHAFVLLIPHFYLFHYVGREVCDINLLCFGCNLAVLQNQRQVRLDGVESEPFQNSCQVMPQDGTRICKVVSF